MQDGFITRGDVAKMLSISERSISKLPIPFVTLSARRVRYLRKDVLAFTASLRREASK